MNMNAYNAVRRDPGGAGVMAWKRSWLRVTGQDRQAFLNGQLSNDIIYLAPGQGVPACLLNNTGHMVAAMYVHATEQEVWLELNPLRAGVAVETLKRFIIRERVEIADWTGHVATFMVQGQGSRGIISSILSQELPDRASMPLSNTPVTTRQGHEGYVVQHQHTCATSGFDLVVPASDEEAVHTALLDAPGAEPMDPNDYETLRVEGGIPRWGAELDETIIPLEANLYSAINQNKGCYMGQEVIARILSRGHTNRSLVGFRLSGPVAVGAKVRAEAGDASRRNQEIGRLTSVVESPEAGWIALGYVRNEHARLGNVLHAEDAEAAIATLPFVA